MRHDQTEIELAGFVRNGRTERDADLAPFPSRLPRNGCLLPGSAWADWAGRLPFDDPAGQFDPPGRCHQAIDTVEQKIERHAADFAHGDVDRRERRIVEIRLGQIVHVNDGDIAWNPVVATMESVHSANRQYGGKIQPALGNARADRLGSKLRQPVLDLKDKISTSLTPWIARASHQPSKRRLMVRRPRRMRYSAPIRAAEQLQGVTLESRISGSSPFTSTTGLLKPRVSDSMSSSSRVRNKKSRRHRHRPAPLRAHQYHAADRRWIG